MPGVPRLSLPVAVIMGCKSVRGAGWEVPSWRVVGVVAGAGVPGPEAKGAPACAAGDERRLIWGGLRLQFYRDAADSYWVNLTGQQPSLFVLCSETEDGTVVPYSVTADQNEACSGVEGDDRVFATPIPPEVYHQLEQFVVEHNVPQQKRKRKRKNWAEREES